MFVQMRRENKSTGLINDLPGKWNYFRVARHLPRIRNRPGRERYGLFSNSYGETMQ
jgi:hypothetical protein